MTTSRNIIFTFMLLAMGGTALAITCNVNDSKSKPLTCSVKNDTFADTCASCTSGGIDYGFVPCISWLSCPALKTACENEVKGVYSSCTTNNCNKCTSSAHTLVFPIAAIFLAIASSILF